MRDKTGGKDTYEAPAIRRIRFVEGELAAKACKTNTDKMGPTGSGCFLAMCSASAS
jgi:hypothetical protein